MAAIGLPATASTCPLARSVAAHLWVELPASAWMDRCNALEQAMPTTMRNSANSPTDTNGLPCGDLRHCFTVVIITPTIIEQDSCTQASLICASDLQFIVRARVGSFQEIA